MSERDGAVEALASALHATGNTAGVPGQDRGEATELMAERIVDALEGYRLVPAAPAPPALDVERLVTAFDRAGMHLNGKDYDLLVRVAAEYARLAAQQDAP